MTTEERRAATRSAHWWGLFKRGLSAAHLIVLTLTSIFMGAIGVAGFALTDHLRIQEAVPRAEFVQVIRAVSDTMHEMRADNRADHAAFDVRITANTAALDSTIGQFREFLTHYQRTQIHNLCAIAKSDADICAGK